MFRAHELVASLADMGFSRKYAAHVVRHIDPLAPDGKAARTQRTLPHAPRICFLSNAHAALHHSALPARFAKSPFRRARALCWSTVRCTELGTRARAALELCMEYIEREQDAPSKHDERNVEPDPGGINMLEGMGFAR